MNLDEEPFLDAEDLPLTEFSLSLDEKRIQRSASRPLYTNDRFRRVLSSKPMAFGNWFIIITNVLAMIFTWNRLAAVKSYCPDIPYSEFC